MKKIFDVMPKCEICGVKVATHFSAIQKKGTISDWKFVCNECERDNWEYSIPIEAFFISNNSILECLDHLHEKIGMDWQSFMNMIHRYRQRTQGDDGSLERMIAERLDK